MKHLGDEAKEAGKHTAVTSSREVLMIQAFNGASHIVNLAERTCTCLEFQDKKLPCRHAILGQEYNLESEVHLGDIYRMETYRGTYGTFMPPICIEDLHCSSDCPVPLIRRKSGRLKKKRREKKKKNLCMKRYSFCRSTDHNRRRCDQEIPPQGRCRDNDNNEDLDDSSTANSTIDNDTASSFAGFSDYHVNPESLGLSDSSSFSGEDATIFASNVNDQPEQFGHWNMGMNWNGRGGGRSGNGNENGNKNGGIRNISANEKEGMKMWVLMKIRLYKSTSLSEGRSTPISILSEKLSTH